jgi:hypothetical protein
MELLSGQGNMTRAMMTDAETPEEMMMQVSEKLLKSVGLKNPNPLIVLKMSQGLGNMAGSVLGQKAKPVEQTIKTGKELFNDNLF